MTSGLPRLPVTGSASCAPASASVFISGSGLISLFIGMKPDTIAPAEIGTGKGRIAIVSAAAARASGGSASRRACMSRRSAAFCSEMSKVSSVILRCERSEPQGEANKLVLARQAGKSAEPHRPLERSIPGSLRK